MYGPSAIRLFLRRLIGPAALSLALLAGTGAAKAEISSSAVASGSYAGKTVMSDAAVTSLEVAPAAPRIGIELQATYRDEGAPEISVGDPVDYEMTVTNTGNVSIAGLVLQLQLSQGDESFEAIEPRREGDAGPPGVLGRGETWRYSARYGLALDNLERHDPLISTATASGLGTGIPVTGQAKISTELPPLQGIAPRLISISHVPDAMEASPGQTMGYAITVSNRSDRDLSAHLTALLADGVVPPESVPPPGSAPAQPPADLSRVDFGVVRVGAGSSSTIRYTGLVKEAAVRGFHVNAALIADPATGIELIPPANATVQTGPAPQPGCTGIAVRVYDDVNRDGRADEGEGGISGVRVSAGSGNPLTTAPDGWFRSPCVAVSRLSGIDLRFDLDEGTLPDGFFLTTANPLGLKVAPGSTGEAVFGAAEARIVRIDLNEAAFLHNSVEPDPEMADGITRLISVLGREPSILRLTYYAHREAPGLAEQRLEAVRKSILDQWAASAGGYELKIDAHVAQSDG